LISAAFENMSESEMLDRSNGTWAANPGPEVPTLAEKFVKVLRLPYILGCIAWALIFLQIPVTLDTFLRSPRATTGQGMAYLIVIFILALYFPLSVRFVRARVLEAESKLIPLLPNGEADYHERFGQALSYRGQIIIIIVLALMAIPVDFQFESALSRFLVTLNAAYIVFMLGSLIWFNSGCVVGLYRLGRKPLKFSPFRQDPKMGTSPIGSISLSLALSYFAGIVILILFTAVTPYQSFKSSYLIIIYAVLISVGLVMFFLPLIRVHFRMAEEKVRQNLIIQGHFDSASYELKQEELGEPLLNIQKLLCLDMADRKLQAISTWPFDTALLGRLSLIIASVIATLVARGLMIPFHM
jgi:hypothetical protein